MSLLQTSDFVGAVSLSQNEFDAVKLQLYIDRFEVRYLTDLLGCDMYDDFVADLIPTPAVPTSAPTDAKFTAIFNPFCIDEQPDTGCQHVSEGIKEMLKFFIYFEWARDNQYTMAITGATKNTFSNAEIATIIETRATENYNLAIKTYQAIQWYIDDENPNNYDYSNYNGIRKGIISWL